MPGIFRVLPMRSDWSVLAERSEIRSFGPRREQAARAARGLPRAGRGGRIIVYATAGSAHATYRSEERP